MYYVPFSLESFPGDAFVRFPFLWKGSPWQGPEHGSHLSCAISLRSAGEMGFAPNRPNPNRTALFSLMGIPADSVFARVQTHSKDVAVVEPSSTAAICLPPGDGLATKDRSAVLSVTVADCLPVFLADTETGAAALLHSGWKGTGIAEAALRLMRARWGTRPERVAAVLGPCVRGCCYEVDSDRAALFDAEFGSLCDAKPLGPAVRRDGSRCFIDLQAANAALLEAAGVRNIAYCLDCTFTDERLGSFRRQGADSFTRMAALLGRLP